MNEQTLESFISTCDEMMVPVQEGLVKYSKIIILLRDLIQKFKIWLKRKLGMTVFDVHAMNLIQKSLFKVNDIISRLRNPLSNININEVVDAINNCTVEIKDIKISTASYDLSKKSNPEGYTKAWEKILDQFDKICDNIVMKDTSISDSDKNKIVMSITKVVTAAEQKSAEAQFKKYNKTPGVNTLN